MLTPDAAKAATLTVQPGIAGKTAPKSANETIVHDVAITAVDGKKYDVKVDANSDNLLKSVVDDENKGRDSKFKKTTQSNGMFLIYPR